MLKIVAGGQTTSAISSTLSGINRTALDNAKFLFAQANLAAANADGVTEEERQHHLRMAAQVTIESAVFTSRGKRYAYRAIPVVRS
jgi:hypothetical protein